MNWFCRSTAFWIALSSLAFVANASADFVYDSATSTYFTSAALPFDIEYSGAQDNAGGSGLKDVALFLKLNSGAWTAANQSLTAASGTFTYTIGAAGSYQFGVKAEDVAGNLSALQPGAQTVTVKFDTTPPNRGNLVAPVSASVGPLALNYVAATDNIGGAGIFSVTLWYKKDNGIWQATSQTASATSGKFTFVASEPGTYYFGLQNRDRVGNLSAAPSGSGSASTRIETASPTDSCPTDPNKTVPGLCGCGVPEDTGDVDHDGIINCLDTDNDNDGLTDSVEKKIGTNPRVADSDGDGVSDGEEVSKGTNPLDSGSVAEVLDTTLCSEWNGFLGGMWNILELVNTSSKNLNVTTTLYSIDGAVMSRSKCAIAHGGQCDVLVHGMQGRVENSYGKVCSSHDGSPGDLDGRMVYYKQALAPTTNAWFDFAFAMPLTNGKTGNQYVSFNTYQPSYVPAEAGFPVANWIQLTNLSKKNVHGTLSFYGQDGSRYGQQDVQLGAGERRDFSGHQFGPSLVGLVEWSPSDASIPCSLRNVRYLYDNAGGNNSFFSAFQLEGLHGSGELLSVPLDTRSASAIVEILNTLSEAISTNVKVYNQDGSLKGTFKINLPSHGSYHLITDSVLGDGQRGIATIQGSKLHSVVAVGMEYGRNAGGGIDYLYGIAGSEAIGEELKGSYNTFLAQDAELVLVNPGNSAMGAKVTMTRGDVSTQSSDQLPSKKAVIVPGKGLFALHLNDFESPDHFGVITVQPTTGSSLLGWSLRTRGREYVIPTPVRD